MQKIIVELGERSYPIIIESGLFDSVLSGAKLQYGDAVMLITDDHVATLHLESLCNILSDFGVFVDQLVLLSGERYKSLSSLEYIVTKLLEKRYDRNVILFAFGGGVIGDLVGFAAASYRRGVRFVQVPTTLLSQVDASIGGKTAVNHPLAKNMIGAFYQPVSVIINLDYLYTLSRRELSCGLAEVIKYGIALDYDFFEWIECNIESILNLEITALTYCVRRCCELKSIIVQNDEYDQGKGVRALLNLGHTYGHAIESYFKYGQEWLHGEAISVGMMMAAHLSSMFGYFNNYDIERIKLILLRAGLPVYAPSKMTVEDYLFYMICDKKNIADKLSFVLPVAIGQAQLFTDLRLELIKNSIMALK